MKRDSRQVEFFIFNLEDLLDYFIFTFLEDSEVESASNDEIETSPAWSDLLYIAEAYHTDHTNSQQTTFSVLGFFLPYMSSTTHSNIKDNRVASTGSSQFSFTTLDENGKFRHSGGKFLSKWKT